MLPCELSQLVLLSSDLLPVATSSKRELHPKIMHNSLGLIFRDCLNYKRFKMFTGNCIEQSYWSCPNLWIYLFLKEFLLHPCECSFVVSIGIIHGLFYLQNHSFIIIWSILYSFDISYKSIKLYIYNNFITQHFNWNHLLLLQLQTKNELLRFQHLYLNCHIYTCMQDMWFDQFNLFYCYTR